MKNNFKKNVSHHMMKAILAIGLFMQSGYSMELKDQSQLQSTSWRYYFYQSISGGFSSLYNYCFSSTQTCETNVEEIEKEQVLHITNMPALPIDIWKDIFWYKLNLEDLIQVRAVCRAMNVCSIRPDQILPNHISLKDIPKGWTFIYPHLTILDCLNTNDVRDVNLQSLTNLKKLSICGNIYITDNGISLLTDLTDLNLYRNEKITDNALLNLTNLMILNLQKATEITGKYMLSLKKLKDLSLSEGSKITGEIVSKLSNLTRLSIIQHINIKDQDIMFLTNLEFLDLCYNHKITGTGLSNLTKLVGLSLGETFGVYTQIKNSDLLPLSNLTFLCLNFNINITNEGVSLLTNLTNLDLGCNSVIKNDGISSLTKLETLILRLNEMLTDDALLLLTNLTNIDLSNNRKITINGISHLINLQTVTYSDSSGVKFGGEKGRRERPASLSHLTNLSNIICSHDHFPPK